MRYIRNPVVLLGTFLGLGAFSIALSNCNDSKDKKSVELSQSEKPAQIKRDYFVHIPFDNVNSAHNKMDMVSGDFDKDGYTDLVFVRNENNVGNEPYATKFYFFKGTKDESCIQNDKPFAKISFEDVNSAHNDLSVVASDFDKDGDLDLLVARNENNNGKIPYATRTYLLRNKGHGIFEWIKYEGGKNEL